MSETSPRHEPDDAVLPVVAATAGRVSAPRVGGRRSLCIVALVCVSVVTLVVIGIRNIRKAADPAPRPATARALVAGHDIPAGTAITAENLDDLFQWADVPPEAVPPDAVGEPTRLIGTETVRTMKAGDPVAESDSWAGLPDGFMLVSLRGDVSDGFGSGYTRGTKIDVWLTPNGKLPPWAGQAGGLGRVRNPDLNDRPVARGPRRGRTWRQRLPRHDARTGEAVGGRRGAGEAADRPCETETLRIAPSTDRFTVSISLCHSHSTPTARA